MHSPKRKKQVDDHVSVATDDNSDDDGEQTEEKEEEVDGPRVDTGHEGHGENRSPPTPPPPSRHPLLAQEDTTETSNGERESREKA